MTANEAAGDRTLGVRGIDTARDLPEGHKDLHWTLKVRAEIRRVFLEEEELHIDDLAEPGAPAEHQSIVREQIARLVRARYVVTVDRRTYELTESGRRKLAEISAGRGGTQ